MKCLEDYIINTRSFILLRALSCVLFVGVFDRVHFSCPSSRPTGQNRCLKVLDLFLPVCVGLLLFVRIVVFVDILSGHSWNLVRLVSLGLCIESATAPYSAEHSLISVPLARLGLYLSSGEPSFSSKPARPFVGGCPSCESRVTLKALLRDILQNIFFLDFTASCASCP